MIVTKNSISSISNPIYPKYIFRGHEEQIMSLEFDENNSYILSGDSGGTIIIWDLITKRPIIKFKGHTKGILRVTLFHDKLISHGRDNFIHVWKLNQYLKNLKINELKPFCEESKLNPENSLFINSASFCKFDLYCKEGIEQEEILVAIPRYCMALKLFPISQPNNYLMLASYENGSVVLWSITINQIDTSSKDDNNKRIVIDQLWNCKEHVETLGLDISVDKKFAISTAGDNKIVKYTFDENYQNEPIIKSTILKHSGIADVKIRSDGKIFATAGWDAKFDS
ncbi:7664_t:CDS:2 [Diversispora eburnea]|uniref:ASTRA-associated protein 1 n=1 Tax=Diversispora eburnea TaxID=1213867 RepID=A0A9N9BNQ1_9GLOM|nr:7664_t:CDS:2 [Diversispora eburnea]